MYSQFGEDDWIFKNLQLPFRGTFVEVGASNGMLGSNTLALERHRGWKGLCIEPDPRNHSALERSRICKIARCLAGTGASDAVSLHLHPTHGWTGTLRTDGPTTNVPRIRLDTLLAIFGIGSVDLLSIDTEGTELDVWRSLGTFPRPTIVIVEYDTAELPSTEADLMRVFSGEGYHLVHRTEANLIFQLPSTATPQGPVTAT